MESKWVQNQENEIRAYFVGKKTYSPMLLGSIMVLFLLLLIAIVIMQDNRNGQSDLFLILCGIIIFTCGLLLYMASRSKPLTLQELRIHLKNLLRDQTELHQFDKEMNQKPIYEMKLKEKDGVCFFTEHYLIRIYGQVPTREYAIFKLSDIKATKAYCQKDKDSISGYGKEYVTSLCDFRNNVLGEIKLKGKNEFDAFEQALLEFIPEIHLGAGKIGKELD